MTIDLHSADWEVGDPGDGTLISKLADVMSQIKYIQKSGYNNFHQYSYATEADVAEKVREELVEQNVMMFTSVHTVQHRETKTRKGNTEYIATLTIECVFLCGDTGQWVKLYGVGEGQDPGDKATYKALTGAVKYALMKNFLIPTGDDPEQDRPQTGSGGHTGGGEGDSTQSQPSADSEQSGQSEEQYRQTLIGQATGLAKQKKIDPAYLPYFLGVITVGGLSNWSGPAKSEDATTEHLEKLVNSLNSASPDKLKKYENKFRELELEEELNGDDDDEEEEVPF